MPRTLHVKKTDYLEIVKNWGFEPAIRVLENWYVRCNKNGNINWSVAPIYKASELIERNNVKIIQ